MKQAKFGEASISLIDNRLANIAITEILENKAFYHRDCYSILCSVTKLKRAENRFKNAICLSKSVEFIPKIGQPNERQRIENISTENQSQSHILCSSGILYNHDLCAICQKDGGLLRNASFEKTGEKYASSCQRSL